MCQCFSFFNAHFNNLLEAIAFMPYFSCSVTQKYSHRVFWTLLWSTFPAVCSMMLIFMEKKVSPLPRFHHFRLPISFEIFLFLLVWFGILYRNIPPFICSVLITNLLYCDILRSDGLSFSIPSWEFRWGTILALYSDSSKCNHNDKNQWRKKSTQHFLHRDCRSVEKRTFYRYTQQISRKCLSRQVKRSTVLKGIKPTKKQ